MANILVYGGTFDPVHYGHITPVKHLLQSRLVDKLIYVPCKTPVHKQQAQIDASHRHAMLQLMIKDCFNDFDVSTDDFELTSNSANYSVNTLEYFKRQYPNDQLMFLIGMDSLLNLHSWHQYQRIFELAQLIVIKRPGFELNKQLPQPVLSRIDTAIQIVEAPEVAVSSTQIRTALVNNKPHNLAEHIPNSVFQYIQQQQLYQSR